MDNYFLYSNPSFLSGMSRIFDFGQSLNEYNTSLSPEEADLNAIKSDWATVGIDIISAMAKYEDQHINHGEK